MTKTKRKTYTSRFKFALAKEALKGASLSSLSRQYGVSVNVLSKWARQLDEQGFHIFETAPDQEKRKLERKLAGLEQLVGKKEVELNLLKNFSDFYELPNTS